MKSMKQHSNAVIRMASALRDHVSMEIRLARA